MPKGVVLYVCESEAKKVVLRIKCVQNSLFSIVNASVLWKIVPSTRFALLCNLTEVINMQ